jgi:hypothetical protein
MMMAHKRSRDRVCCYMLCLQNELQQFVRRYSFHWMVRFEINAEFWNALGDFNGRHRVWCVG